MDVDEKEDEVMRESRKRKHEEGNKKVSFKIPEDAIYKNVQTGEWVGKPIAKILKPGEMMDFVDDSLSSGEEDFLTMDFSQALKTYAGVERKF